MKKKEKAKKNLDQKAQTQKIINFCEAPNKGTEAETMFKYAPIVRTNKLTQRIAKRKSHVNPKETTREITWEITRITKKDNQRISAC